MDFKKLWCLPNVWTKYVPEPKSGVEKQKQKQKRKQGVKRGSTIFRGQRLKNEEPAQKKTKIAATNDENLKDKILQTFKTSLDESWSTHKDEIFTAQSAESGDNDNSQTINYVVNLGLIFDDFAQKLPDHVIKHQQQILEKIKDGSNDKTSTGSSENAEKQTQ